MPSRYKAPSGLIAPTDYSGMRGHYLKAVTDAVSKAFPVEGDVTRVEVFDVAPAQDVSYGVRDVRKAVLDGKSLNVPVRARLRVTDKNTGAVLAETSPRTLLRVPYLTDEGTMVRNGVRYVGLKQMRLDPGVYVRRGSDDKVGAAISVEPGTGSAFNIVLEPETGVFEARMGSRRIPLDYILEQMGVPESDRAAAYGGYAKANMHYGRGQKRLGHWREHIIERQRRRLGEGATDAELFRRYFADAGIRPEVSERTLGAPYGQLSGSALLAAARRMIALAEGENTPDSRDSLQYQRVYTFGDILADRISRDHGRVLRERLHGILSGDKAADKLPPLPLEGHVAAMYTGGAPVQTPDMINPIDVHYANNKLVRLGEGAISSIDAAPPEARNVQHSYFNYIDGVVSPESMNLGLDVALARNTFLDPASKRLYTVFLDAATGKRVFVGSHEAPDHVMSTAEDMAVEGDMVMAMDGAAGPRMVPRSKVELVVPSGDELYGEAANSTYATGGIKSMRVNMGARYPSQALPVAGAEAPLVDKRILGADGTETTLSEKWGGGPLGAIRAAEGGRVVGVGDDTIKIRRPSGRVDEYPLRRSEPLPSKTMFDHTPLVKEGDRVPAGAVLARSNFTDDEGRAALGANLTVAWTPYDGLNYEDAVVVSESAARDKLAHEGMYRMRDKFNAGESAYDKRKFTTLFPSRYGRRSLDNLDDSGVVRKGAAVEEGDPLVLTVTRRATGLSAGDKRINMDTSITWDHETPGVVRYVEGGPKEGYRIYVSTRTPADVGDKIGHFFGGKGVIAKVVKDSEMLRDANGSPIDLLISPNTIISRVNPGQVPMAMLGKIAARTGRRYVLPGFSSEDSLVDKAAQELKKHRMSDTETLYNPVTGRERPNQLVGNIYAYKLGQLAEMKGKARSTAFYTAEGLPGRGGAEGSKRIQMPEHEAMLSHGADDVSRDMKVKGRRADELWRAIRTGGVPALSGVPPVYEKYRDMISAMGVNFAEGAEEDSLSAMTSADVEKLAGRKRVANPSTFRQKDGSPVPGGLFDPALFGERGDKWASLELPEPVLNAVMVKPVAALLDTSEKRIEAVAAGREPYKGLYGPDALRLMLGDIKPASIVKKGREAIRSAKSPAARDKAAQKLRYAKAMLDKDARPEDFLLDAVPVLPPRHRPITRMGDTLMVADVNRLYRDLMFAADDFKEARDAGLPQEQLADAREHMNVAYSALMGVADPRGRKNKDMKVKGLLSQLFGKGGGKNSMVQRRLLGGNIDASGLAVITPNPSLKLDQVGLPEAKAWKLYEPFVVGQMTRAGYPATTAARMVADRDPRARSFLVRAVESRPVVVNRAPTLHKYGVMAFRPVLTGGHTLQINPQIVGPYGADFDGDSVLTSIKIEFETEALKEYLEKSEIDDLTLPFSGVYLDCLAEDAVEHNQNPEKESETMLDKRTRVTQVGMSIDLGDFPRIEDTRVEKSETVVEWDVPGGVFVYAYDKDTREKGRYEVSKFSEHRDVRMLEVVVGSKGMYPETLLASEDHSMVVYDGGAIVEKRPEDAVGLMAPSLKDTYMADDTDIVKHLHIGRQISAGYDLGRFIGAVIGDGWVDASDQCRLSSDYGELREALMDISDRELPQKEVACSYEYATERYGKDTMNRINFHLTQDAAKDLARMIGRGSENKRIPPESLMASRAHLRGLLSGLLSTDGQCVYRVSPDRKAPFKAIRYDTTSRKLKDGFVDLCRKLGIRTSTTPYTSSSTGGDAYAINLSLVDFKNFVDKNPGFALFNDERQCVLERILDSMDTAGQQDAKLDLVPYPRHLHSVLLKLREAAGISSSEMYRFKSNGFVSRDTARRLLDVLDDVDDAATVFGEGQTTDLDAWATLVDDTDVTWRKVSKVVEAGRRTCYDITVPGPYTFATGTGLIVQDTMSYSVPVTERGRQAALKYMTPQAALLSPMTHGAVYLPTQEYAGGLHFASAPPRGKVKRTFKSADDAVAAYRRGDLHIDDTVAIL